TGAAAAAGRVGVGPQCPRADRAGPDPPAGGGVDRQALYVGEAVSDRARAPHHDVVGLAGAEDVADLLAGHQGGGVPADVARLEPVPFRLGEVDVHVHLRDVAGDVPVRVHYARHGLHQREHMNG